MTATICAPDHIYDAFVEDFAGKIEHVGFFLAEFRSPSREFILTEWRPVPADGYEFQTDFHVTLKDEVRTDVIKWAWDAGLSLVEVHSHDPEFNAAFSGSDLLGFEQWVPHLWWRLQKRPYAAIVTADDTLDALAWIDGPSDPEQVGALVAPDKVRRSSGLTMRRVHNG